MDPLKSGLIFSLKPIGSGSGSQSFPSQQTNSSGGFPSSDALPSLRVSSADPQANKSTLKDNFERLYRETSVLSFPIHIKKEIQSGFSSSFLNYVPRRKSIRMNVDESELEIPRWITDLCKMNNIIHGVSPYTSPENSHKTTTTDGLSSWSYYELKQGQFFGHRKRIIERKWYSDHYNTLQELMKQKTGTRISLIDGYAGIGKSIFLVWLICKVFSEGSNPSIIYALREEGIFFLQKGKIPVQIETFCRSDYIFSDNVDVSIGAQFETALQVGVTSDTNVFTEFNKRRDELSGSDNDMPAFSLEEIHELVKLNNLRLSRG
jgi:hypothetical protein